MWVCRSHFDYAHHSDKSSRVLITGCGFFIIRLIGALVRGSSSSRCCFVASEFCSPYCNTSFRDFIRKIRTQASWQFDCRYALSRTIINLSGSSEFAFKRLPSWRIWSEKWFRRCIVTKLKSDLSRRCCAIADLIWDISSSMQWSCAATEWLFEVGSVSSSSCLSNISCMFKASETILVDSLTWNPRRTSLGRSNSSR